MKLGLVVLDTLRYDVFREEFDRTTGRADVLFDRLYSTSRWTVPAHASLFTGYYPTEVGTHSGNHHLTTPERTLAERLSRAGYRTIGLSDNTYVDSFFGFDRGFDVFRRGPALRGRPTDTSGFDWASLYSDLSSGVRKYPEALARIVSADAPTIPTVRNGLRFALADDPMANSGTIDWLFDALDDVSLSGDVFVFANLMTCHSPYTAPPAYRSVDPHPVDPFERLLGDDPISSDERERYWQSYRDCARYLDDRLPDLIDAVDWDALFILSDHGELFGEHDLWQHQYGVYEELVRVPGIAIGTTVPAGIDDLPISLLGIHRTVLELADAEHGETRGINAFDPNQERSVVYAESVGNYRYSPDAKGIDAAIPASWGEPHYVYGDDSLRYVVDKDGPRVQEIDSGDPVPSSTKRISEAAEDFRDSLVDVSGTAVDEPVPEAIQSRLEHLGYR